MKRIGILFGVLLFFVFTVVGCSTTKHEQTGADFDTKLKVLVKTVTTYGAGGKTDSKNIYGIEEIKINGHVVELLSNQVTSPDKEFAVDTKEHGPMKIRVVESREGGGTAYQFLLEMTPEQKEQIKALDTKLF